MSDPHLTVTTMSSASVEPFFVDHITADFMKVLYKLSLADQFIVTEKRESMWDYESMQDVMDLVGYNLWYSE